MIKDVHALMAKRFETEGVPIKTGLKSLLEYLKENNYKTIVATSSNRDRVDTILSQAQITDYLMILFVEMKLQKENQILKFS